MDARNVRPKAKLRCPWDALIASPRRDRISSFKLLGGVSSCSEAESSQPDRPVLHVPSQTKPQSTLNMSATDTTHRLSLSHVMYCPYPFNKYGVHFNPGCRGPAEF